MGYNMTVQIQNGLLRESDWETLRTRTNWHSLKVSWLRTTCPSRHRIPLSTESTGIDTVSLAKVVVSRGWGSNLLDTNGHEPVTVSGSRALCGLQCRVQYCLGRWVHRVAYGVVFTPARVLLIKGYFFFDGIDPGWTYVMAVLITLHSFSWIH